jgi:hypothetical protein
MSFWELFRLVLDGVHPQLKGEQFQRDRRAEIAGRHDIADFSLRHVLEVQQLTHDRIYAAGYRFEVLDGSTASNRTASGPIEGDVSVIGGKSRL